MTGTYWDSWGSPLQKFLEDFTDYEVRESILGKPAGVITLMHSVGGKEVLSRLQGVLSSMGFLIPPLTGMTCSLATEIAAKKNPQHAKDFWTLGDLEIVLQNIRAAAELEKPWSAWPVDRKNYKARWL